MDELNLRVAHNIKTLRLTQRIPRREFARRLGYSYQFVWNVETGKVNLPLRTLHAFALQLNTDAVELMGGRHVYTAPTH